MTTHPVYDQLLSEVTDDLERQVLQVLIERAGTKTKASAPDMVFAVFGIYRPGQPKPGRFHRRPRESRECIERLRATWPIVIHPEKPATSWRQRSQHPGVRQRTGIRRRQEPPQCPSGLWMVPESTLHQGKASAHCRDHHTTVLVIGQKGKQQYV